LDYAEIRKDNLDLLNAKGFTVTDWLPIGPRSDVAALRPVDAIACQLIALTSAFLYVSYSTKWVSTSTIRACVTRNQLRPYLGTKGRQIVNGSRLNAVWRHRLTIGWYLENMLSLAWILGFEDEPDVQGTMLNGKQKRTLIPNFVGDLTIDVTRWTAGLAPRSESDVIRLEDRFYCAHNAVRNAQVGRSTVPDGFDPIVNGGVIHERRHALTWAVSPDVRWDDTDLST
jgi:hypothetical protein